MARLGQLARAALLGILVGGSGGSAGGGGPPFPAFTGLETGLLRRYVAALETGLTDGADVDAMTDQSGNADNMSPSNPTNPNTWLENAINGRAAYDARVANMSYSMDTGVQVSTGYSVLFVHNVTSGGGQRWFANGNSDALRFRTDGSGADAEQMGTTQNTTGFVSDNSGQDVATNDWEVCLISYDGATLSHWVGTVTGAADASTGDIGDVNAGTAWWWNGNTGGADGIHGLHAEFVIWDHALDSTERAALATYLNDAYGL